MHQSIPAATTPPPRDIVGHLYAYLSPRPGICSCVFTRGPGICQYRVITPGHLSLTEKRPRPRVSFVVCQNGRLLNTLNKFYIILFVECWFSSMNQCLRFSFSPYYIYCIYNEKLSAIKASVSQPFVDVFM